MCEKLCYRITSGIQIKQYIVDSWLQLAVISIKVILKNLQIPTRRKNHGTIYRQWNKF